MSDPGDKQDVNDRSLELLASVSQAFASSLDLEETLQNAVTQITRYMHAEAASLFLLDDDGENLVCRASAGPIPIDGFSISIQQGIVGRTVRENQLQFIRDVSEDPNFAGFVDEETGFTTRSVLCAPLSLQGERLGALEVMNRDSGDGLFDASDGQMLQVLASSASLVIHNARMAANLVEQERLRKELELAREIQSNLQPPVRKDNFPVAGINIPACEVSGDFYDFFELADGRISFSLGDVSGKGMNAALLMAKISSLLHCLGKDITNPARLLAIVNNEFCESTTRGMFVTLVTGVFDRQRGHVTWANAGHQPPLFRAADGSYRDFAAMSPPVGISADMDYENEQLDLHGGSLYLCSDGVTEGADKDGQPLEVAGLKYLIDHNANEPARSRVETIVSMINAGEPGRRDDVTLLVLDDENQVLNSPVRIHHFKAIPEQLGDVRNWLKRELASWKLDPAASKRLILALNEACMNVIQHGYRGDPGGEMILEIHDNDWDNGGELEFRLTDFAPPLDPSQVHYRDLDDIRPGGLGIYFISEIMDFYEFRVPKSGKGNLLIMKKRNQYEPEAQDHAM